MVGFENGFVLCFVGLVWEWIVCEILCEVNVCY